ncbi:MAG: right-handed parallel beta-helix repeat-containing protein [Halobacteriales archaeon]|nr:right-handed parallel beta-helix repeat-containing protein [Halobacteriales archaeon]
MRRAMLLGVLVMASLAGAAVRGDGGLRIVHPGDPGAFQTIQDGVDAAQPGDTVLIMPGVYHEAVQVHTPDVTVAGADRATTILDGRTTQPTCGDGYGIGVYVDAPGVTVRDLTVRDYNSYGVAWYFVHGFFGYRITSERACVYGIYAIGSDHGEVADSEAWGSGDSGLYVGEVDDCACVLHGNDVHGNSMGYSGTRADHVEIRDNWFHDNGVGILPNTLPPGTDEVLKVVNDGGMPSIVQCCLDIHDNLIEGNNNEGVPPHGFTDTIKLPWGTGIEIAGGSGNTVWRNTIRDQHRWGVALHWLYTPPNDNVVHDNTFDHRGAVDVWWDGWGVGNCFADNGPITSDPSPAPPCGFLPIVGIPDPVKDANLAILALGYLSPVPVPTPLPVPDLPIGYLPPA